MIARRLLTLAAGLLTLAGCSVNVPFDPANSPLGAIGPFLENLRNDVEKALADPLKAKPFPIIIGGDSERVFYATNLADIRLRFSGPTGDVVLPGVLGPSNVYKLQNRERQLIRPLTLASPLAGIVTDGRFVAYLTLTGLDATPYVRVAVSDLVQLSERIVFDPGGPDVPVLGLALDEGRLAFAIVDNAADSWRLRVEDLNGLAPAIEFEGAWFGDIRLRGNRLAYVEENADGTFRVMLRDLATGDALVVADGISAAARPDLHLADNTVVWSEPESADVSRVMGFDIPTGTTFVWADAVEGRVTGASDAFFVVERHVHRLPEKRDRIAVLKYDVDAASKEMARFNADGFAGQLRVLGDRAVWVNPDRKIVIQPLAGGDRRIFRPF